jgi:apolipoprotein N-acyltransferase
MTRRRGGIAFPSLVAGGLIALSLPPWGWWPLGIAGAALLVWRLEGLRLRARVLAGWTAGLACFAPGLWWAQAFNWYGAAVLMVVEAGSFALGAALVPPARGRLLAATGAFTLAEALRMRWPFGGLPLGGVFLGQADGPFLGTARLGGPLLMTAAVWATGAAIAISCSAGIEAAHRRAAATLRSDRPRQRRRARLSGEGGLDGRPHTSWLGPVVAGALVCAVVVVADHAPDGGGPIRTMEVAAVQGGGIRGLSAQEVSPAGVFAAQVEATRLLADRLAGSGTAPALVVWPEDVVALVGADAVPRVGPAPPTGELGVVARFAEQLHATVMAGVTIAVSDRAYRNEIVVWAPSGRIVTIFEKVHRVPFGEYVPDRGFFAHVADLSSVPLDAIAGHASGLVRTPAGPLGVLVSYEVFFADRSRSSVRAGAQVLVVPTNTSSYATSQVPAQEVAADRVQAVESGRDLVQAAPTGYSTLVDDRGLVMARTALGRQQLLLGSIALRNAQTVYVRLGDLPVLLLAALVLLIGVGLEPRVRRRPPSPTGDRIDADDCPNGATDARGTAEPASLVVAGVDVDARDPLLDEHGVVARVVLHGEAQIEPVAAELRHGQALEVADVRVLASVAHHQQVPSQAVALQPGQGLGLDPERPAGEEHDRQRRVE